jgi:hypothetical protein
MLLAGACPLDHTNLWDANTPVQFSISGPTVSHGIGDTLVYTASIDPRWSGGPPQWFSSDESVIRLVRGGHYVTVGVGTAEVIAHLGPHETRTAVSVSQVLKGLGVKTCNAASPDLTYLNQTVSLCPALVDSAGGNIGGVVPAALSSSDPSVASLSGNDVVGVAIGVAWIRGTYQGYTDSLRISVQQIPFAVGISPNPVTLQGGGGSIQLTYNIVDRGGTTIPGAVPVWSTDHPGVIDVGPTGLVTATGWGPATITATYQTAKGTVAVSTTGGSAPLFLSLRATYLGKSSPYALVRADVVDPEGDGSSFDVDGHTMALSRGTGLQTPDALIPWFATNPAFVIALARDQSGNQRDSVVALDTVTTTGVPVVLSVQAFRIGGDSLQVDFTAADNEMDVVEAWLIGPEVPAYHLPLFVRFTLPVSNSVQFSGSIGVKNTISASLLGVVLRDATGAYSSVVMSPVVTR